MAIKNLSTEQTLDTSNPVINLMITNATDNARAIWLNEKGATDKLAITALTTTLALFRLRITLYKNKAKECSVDGFKEFAVRRVLNFSGNNLTDCEYYQAFKKKLDIVNYFYNLPANRDAIKECDPTPDAIEQLTLKVFKNYTSLNQVYKDVTAEKRAKAAKKKADAKIEAQTIQLLTDDATLVAVPEAMRLLQKEAVKFSAILKNAMEIDESQALDSIKSVLELLADCKESHTFNFGGESDSEVIISDITA